MRQWFESKSSSWEVRKSLSLTNLPVNSHLSYSKINHTSEQPDHYWKNESISMDLNQLILPGPKSTPWNNFCQNVLKLITQTLLLSHPLCFLQRQLSLSSFCKSHRHHSSSTFNFINQANTVASEIIFTL